MKSDRKNFTWLFHELKRRKVLRVVAMYAPGAFILLEVMDIITPALALPPWTVTMTIIILAVAFPITIILAWFLIDKDVNVDEGVELLDKALEIQPDNWFYLHESYLHIQEVERTVASL